MVKLGKIGKWFQIFVPPVVLVGIALVGMRFMWIVSMKISTKIGPYVFGLALLSVAVSLSLAFAFNGGINALQTIYDGIVIKQEFERTDFAVTGEAAHESS